MGWTIHWLDTHLSFRELVQWSVYYELEPWGHESEWSRHGILVSALVNVLNSLKAQMVALVKRGGKKPKLFKPKDFIPDFHTGGKKPRQSPQTMLCIVEMLNQAFGGKDLRTKKDGTGKGHQRTGQSKV